MSLIEKHTAKKTIKLLLRPETSLSVLFKLDLRMRCTTNVSSSTAKSTINTRKQQK